MEFLDPSWTALQRFGIHRITTEACGLGMRMKCDLDPQGHRLVSEFFGNTLSTNQLIFALEDGRIGRSEHRPEQGSSAYWNWCSVMLPFSIYADLAAYCLLQEHEVAIILPRTELGPMQVGGCSHAEWREIRERVLRYNPGATVYMKSSAPGNGFRNQHMWTGEVQP